MKIFTMIHFKRLILITLIAVSCQSAGQLKIEGSINNSIKEAASLVSNIKKIFNSLKKNLKNQSIIKDFIDENKKINIEYLELRNKNNLSKKINKKNAKLFIAFYIKGIRLIDNF